MLEKFIEALILNTKFGKQYIRDVQGTAVGQITNRFDSTVKNMRNLFNKEVTALKQQIDTMEREYYNLEESYRITEQNLAATTFSYDYTSDCLANKSKELLTTQDELKRANEMLKAATNNNTELAEMLSYCRYALSRATNTACKNTPTSDEKTTVLP